MATYVPSSANKCYAQRGQIVRKLQLTVAFCNEILPQ